MNCALKVTPKTRKNFQSVIGPRYNSEIRNLLHFLGGSMELCFPVSSSLEKSHTRQELIKMKLKN